VTHYRSMFDTDYVGVWDLDGRDRIATITKVVAGTVGGQNGRDKERKPIVTLAEFDAPMICNVTNARAIAGMYGNDVRKWKGKRITLYPTTTRFGSDEVECIRVRPKVPRGEPEHVGSRPVDREVRDRQNAAAGNAPHPAQPIADAADAAGLLAALKVCAPWVDANAKVAWPKIAARCAELNVDINAAEAAVNAAVEGPS